MAKAQAPDNVRIQIRDESYKDATDGMSTHRQNSVGVRADIRSQQEQGEEHGGKVRLVVQYSASKNFKGKDGGTEKSDWGGTRKNETVHLRNLKENTRYYTKIRVEQRNLDKMSNAREVDFYTERRPYPPRLDAPSDNVTIREGGDVTFAWTHQDADDPGDNQTAAEFRYRRAATLTNSAGEWKTIKFTDATSEHDLNTTNLGGNQHYDWQVRTKDPHSTWWSEWAFRSFYISGATTAPSPTSPINDEATSTDDGMLFEWKFRDPDKGEEQTQADIRYRVVGSSSLDEEGWTLITGTGDLPGGAGEWFIEPGVLLPGVHYQWQVRTYNSVSVSGWSNTETFRAIREPGWAVSQDEDTPVPIAQGALGTGVYRVYAYDQGGRRYRGEITPFASLTWTRLRDDISHCTLRTSGFSEDCGRLLGDLRTWNHEIVVFRNGERVWEGPITRLSFYRDSVEIEARDPMIYVYRRIMRQGYNDNFRRPGQGIQGSRTVVQRASIIIQNAMAPYDDFTDSVGVQRGPNVLAYLTVIGYPDDARESRTVPDWSKTAWEEVDDLAATAGLDYTCVGRRIILHDTHRPVGLLAEFREKDFFESPIITEYGMSAANIFGVTSNTGVYGKFQFKEADWFGAGPIEQLASAYGEGADAPADPKTLTREQKNHLAQVLDIQAARNINGRWAAVHIDRQGTDDIDDDEVLTGAVFGAPVIARVPDNSRLHPEAYVGINQLIPGVHVPLRVVTMCRSFAQVQKLDSVTVTVENGEEKVQVVMSPAPTQGLDPDQGLGSEVL